MIRRVFAFERGGAERLEISWKPFWKDAQVTLDGTVVGKFETKRQLEAGDTFALPDGSQLHVQLKVIVFVPRPELHLRRNGEPLPGSDGDPKRQVGVAVFMLWFLAALNVCGGLIAVLGRVKPLLELDVGWDTILIGAIYGGCGYWAKAKQSRVALVLALLLLVLDAVVIFIFGRTPSLFFTRLFLSAPIWRALWVLTQLKRKTALLAPGNQPLARSSRSLKIVLAGLGFAVLAGALGTGFIKWWYQRTTVVAARCDDRVDPLEFDLCLKSFASTTDDSGLCDKMRSPERAKARLAELETLAFQRRQCLALTEGIPRFNCVTSFVEDGGDLELCQLVESGWQREGCLGAGPGYVSFSA